MLLYGDECLIKVFLSPNFPTPSNTDSGKKQEKNKIIPISIFLYMELQYLLTKCNQSSRESYHISHVHVLFNKVLVFGEQMWKRSQPDTHSEEKEMGS